MEITEILSGKSKTFSSILDILDYRAEMHPEKDAFIYLEYEGDKKKETHLTFRQLANEAKEIAGYLQSVCTTGERAMLLYPPGLEFIKAFFGCLYAGVTGIPSYHNISRKRLSKTASLITDSGASYILCPDHLAERLSRIFENQIPVIPTDKNRKEGYSPVPVNENTIAYLQYTSGSISTPKGVMISHGNIMHNEKLLRQAFNFSFSSVGVCWLPHHHDMGLVLNILMPVYAGSTYVLQSPFDFMQMPYRWLEAFSDYKGTHGGAPNFAYDLLSKTVSQADAQKLNLSAIKTLWNGAEPVRYQSMSGFYHRFKQQGLCEAAIYPSYGMAETTLIISGEKPVSQSYNYIEVDSEIMEKEKRIRISSDSKRSQILVSNGKVIEGETFVKIVDPDTAVECAPDQIGEIWVSSPSVALGYWNKPEETKACFRAHITGINDRHFFRTGDVGFIHKDEIYITGRLKDLIIIRGVNYLPHDMEYTAEKAHSALRPDSSAAFSIPVDGEERLALVVEIRRDFMNRIDPDELLTTIRTAISENHELQLYTLVAVSQGQVPKTTSGKIQRKLCKDLLLKNQLNFIFQDTLGNDTVQYSQIPDHAEPEKTALTHDEIESQLISHISKSLKIDKSRVKSARNLISLGLDSLTLTTLKQFVENEFYISIELSDLFDHSFGMKELTQYICENKSQNKAARLPQIIPAVNDESTSPLTELQHAYWIGRNGRFELGNTSAHAYLEIVINEEIDLNRFSESLNQVICRHDLLHSVITEKGELLTVRDIRPYEIKLNDLNDVENKEAILGEIRNAMGHEILLLDKSPLFHIQLTKCKHNTYVLHLSIDLLIADIASIRIFLKDWYNCYRSKQLPPLTITFRDYVLSLDKIKETPLYGKSKTYWLSKIDKLYPAPQLTLRIQPGELKNIRFTHREKILDEAAFDKLKALSASYGITPSALLLTVYSLVISSWSKSNRFTINVTLFNRMDLHPEINELVGDFTSTVLLGVQCSDIPFIELAAGIQRDLSKDLDHKYFNGIEVMRELAKHENKSSVMPVVFTGAISQKQSSSKQTYYWGERIYSISQTPQVWIDNQVFDEDNHLVLVWDSIDELFPPGMIGTMFDTYSSFIDSLLTEHAAVHTSCPGLIPETQLIVREKYNATENNHSPELLYTGFLRNATNYPDQLAICTSGRTITYGELRNAAFAIANKIGEYKPDQSPFIGVYMTKGWEQIAAVLGIQLAGYAYVSIDPNLPDERKKILIEDAELSLVVTQTNTQFPVKISFIECNDSLLQQNTELKAYKSTDASGLAYLIYTSGSTGRPKGVYVSHESAFNTIQDINCRFNLTRNDKVLALSSLSFDLSVFDIFGMLTCGGAIVIPDGDSMRNPEHFQQLIRKYHVTIWNSVPSYMAMFLEYMENKQLTSTLGLVMLSGDWIPVNMPGRIKRMNSDTQVISLGGATEAAVWSIYYPVEQVGADWKSIPYGMPLSNQKIFVLNENLSHCPDEVIGEIYIGGIGLARGYWKDLGKTGQSFIRWKQTGERLYKTGDMGKFKSEGYVEFLGREDSQVKIGGYRIEIGEIENALNKHPQVDRSVIIKQSNKSGNDYLAAYVVVKEVSDKEGGKNKIGAGLILDSNERRLFRLQQHGIRNLTGKAVQLADSAGEDLMSEYSKRATSRRFTAQPVSFRQLSGMLGSARIRSIDRIEKHKYASAGNLYPVQLYVYIHSDEIEDLPAGTTWYYHPKSNSLLQLNCDVRLSPDVHVPENQSVFTQGQFSVFLIADMNAITPMYGTESFNFCLLEAGLITQLLETSAVKNELGLCQIGQLNDTSFLKDMFLLDNHHVLLHSMIGGSVDYNNPKRSVSLTSKDDRPEVPILDSLKQHCMDKLPAYMVPVKWKLLDELPLSATGKIDYRKLASLEEAVAERVTPAECRSDDETRIAAIVKEQLGNCEIDMQTNFFELGADSHSLVKIWGRVTSEFKQDFPVIKIFEYPTVRKLSDFIKQNNQTVEETDVELRDQMQRKSLQQRRNAGNILK